MGLRMELAHSLRESVELWIQQNLGGVEPEVECRCGEECGCRKEPVEPPMTNPQTPDPEGIARMAVKRIGREGMKRRVARQLKLKADTTRTTSKSLKTMLIRTPCSASTRKL